MDTPKHPRRIEYSPAPLWERQVSPSPLCSHTFITGPSCAMSQVDRNRLLNVQAHIRSQRIPFGEFCTRSDGETGLPRDHYLSPINTEWRGADWHISNLNIVLAQYLVVIGGKGNGRGEDTRTYCTRFFPVGGILKDRVFRRRIMTIQELKQAIVDEVATIDEDLRRRVYGNLQARLQQCIDVSGSHLPGVQKISL